MSVFVERIVNSPIESNAYVLYQQQSNECFVIDPGTEDCERLIKFLDIKKLIPKFLILTHEHFDHIWGTNKLIDKYGAKLVCSLQCNNKIIEAKKNLSIFYNQVGFATYAADIFTDQNPTELFLGSSIFSFFNTPGHSEGSISFSIDEKLFVGDLMIKDLATVTKLPGGNKQKLAESMEFIRNRFNDTTVVYPGHGNVFMLSEFKK